MAWRELMKYPELIPENNGEFEDLMDTLESLIPIKDYGNRTDTFLIWVSDGIDAGLITRSEKQGLQEYLINGYGGF